MQQAIFFPAPDTHPPHASIDSNGIHMELAYELQVWFFQTPLIRNVTNSFSVCIHTWNPHFFHWSRNHDKYGALQKVK
jgi:hypothetical protein